MLAWLAALTLAGTVQAQNALGDGTALDANTGQQGARNYQRPSFTQELSFRNAVATGNAPGGLSFRGDLGYRAAGEFEGALGSDSLFAFRRDSLYSGLAGMGIRGTDALQYQFALTTGAAPPRNLMGNLSLARDNYYNPDQYNPDQTGTPTRQIPNGDAQIGYDQDGLNLDQRGKALLVPSPGASPSTAGLAGSLEPNLTLGTLRSSSTYATTVNLQPALLSVYSDGIDRKPIGLIASPLLGITSTPLSQDKPASNPLIARPPSGSIDSRISNAQASTRLTTSYDVLVEQMRQHVESMRTQADQTNPPAVRPDETNDAWLTRKMRDLQEQIYGAKPTSEDDSNAADPNAPTSTNPGSSNSTDPGNTDAKPTDGPIDNPTVTIPSDPKGPLSKAVEDRHATISADSTDIELYDPTQIAIDPDTLEVLRGAAAKEVDQLLDPDAAQRDLYTEHLSAGQQLLASGRYFDAEERFTHALSIRPGDVPAQLGRLHAQIGAGMVLSASVNLQSLFTQHPEVIASRYTGKLMPDQARVGSLIDRLKERSGITHPEHSTRLIESDRTRVSAALLLSYLGYQHKDEQAIEQGLEVVKALGSDTDRRFGSLLAQLWLGQDADQSTSGIKSGSNPRSNTGGDPDSTPVR